MSKILILIIGLALAGCKTTPNLSDIPLKGGEMPYQIPAGTYYDTRGGKHIEPYPRWSLSEQDLFEDTVNLKPIKK